jgi:hypothetical protein
VGLLFLLLHQVGNTPDLYSVIGIQFETRPGYHLLIEVFHGFSTLCQTDVQILSSYRTEPDTSIYNVPSIHECRPIPTYG